MPEYSVAAQRRRGLEVAGLVGEGCPWVSVQQMGDDLGSAVHAITYAGKWDKPEAPGKRSERFRAASALLSNREQPMSVYKAEADAVLSVLGVVGPMQSYEYRAVFEDGNSEQTSQPVVGDEMHRIRDIAYARQTFIAYVEQRTVGPWLRVVQEGGDDA